LAALKDGFSTSAKVSESACGLRQDRQSPVKNAGEFGGRIGIDRGVQPVRSGNN